MKSNILWALTPLALLVSVPAQAHFKVEAPADALVTNATGDPIGGSQKTGPCGTGNTPSNMVTQVRAGAKLHVKVRETIVHGGHYRVAVASNRNSFVTPTPVVQNNNCISAPIQNPVVSPVVADGLFPHQDVGGPRDYEADVTMPTAVGKYTVQLIEFMTPHAPPCFYFHCANVEVVESDAGLADGGVVIVDGDGGSNSSGGPDNDGGDPGDPANEADASSGGDPADPNSSGGGGARLRNSGSSDGGCNGGGGAMPSLVTMSVFGVMATSLLRRRRRQR